MVALEDAELNESVVGNVEVVAVSETATQITILDAAIQVRFLVHPGNFSMSNNFM